ncbi:MAG TPA: permease-like cell division protein FtsX [Thermoleophilaceae bacterium]|nr:permease-like cell division protein FtsX [Thermoleophilaceae bacterium]
MRFGFFLKESLRALTRNAAPSLAAMLTVILTALVLGLFIPVVQATTGTANRVRHRVVVNVYLANGITQEQQTAVHNKLIGLPNSKEVQFISKDAALKELEASRKGTKEAFNLLGANPLPDTYRVVPKDPGKVQHIVNALVTTDPATGKKTFAVAGIGDVRNRESDTSKILTATSLVKSLTAGMAALLVLASIALIANTIRLSIFARRREVEVMKLVGATNWFIRWPFVIEGVIVGFMGGLVAVLLLWIVKDTLVDPLANRFALIAAPNTIHFPELIAVLLVSCVAVSAIGSGLTLRRFLRV